MDGAQHPSGGLQSLNYLIARGGSQQYPTTTPYLRLRAHPRPRDAQTHRRRKPRRVLHVMVVQPPSGGPACAACLRSPCGSSGGGRAATQRPLIGQLARVACHACLRVPGRVRGTAKRPLHARRHVDSPQAGRRARYTLAHIAVVTPPLRPYPPSHGLRTVLRVVCTCVYVRVRSCRGGDAVE